MTAKIEDILLAGIDELKADVKAMRKSLQQCREDVAGLKVKAGIWGVAGGLMSGLIMMAMWVIKAGK